MFFLLHTVPVIQGFFYSFTDYAGYGSWNWVGFKNYANLFNDDRIRNSYRFTIKFAVVATILINIVSLAIANFLNSKIKFRTPFRGMFFMPFVMSILIVGYIFNFMFANSLPWFGEKLGIGWLSTNILANESIAWLGIVAVQTWSSMAFTIIIYLAGLQTIDPQLYEAASLDGASGWLQFRSITFPLLAAFFTINMVITLKCMLMVFDLIFSLTNGGPGTSTESISVVIYRGGFEGGEFAYQMANAIDPLHPHRGLLDPPAPLPQTTGGPRMTSTSLPLEEFAFEAAAAEDVSGSASPSAPNGSTGGRRR